VAVKRDGWGGRKEFAWHGRCQNSICTAEKEHSVDPVTCLRQNMPYFPKALLAIKNETKSYIPPPLRCDAQTTSSACSKCYQIRILDTVAKNGRHETSTDLKVLVTMFHSILQFAHTSRCVHIQLSYLVFPINLAGEAGSLSLNTVP